MNRVHFNFLFCVAVAPFVGVQLEAILFAMSLFMIELIGTYLIFRDYSKYQSISFFYFLVILMFLALYYLVMGYLSFSYSLRNLLGGVAYLLIFATPFLEAILDIWAHEKSGKALTLELAPILYDFMTLFLLFGIACFGVYVGHAQVDEIASKWIGLSFAQLPNQFLDKILLFQLVEKFLFMMGLTFFYGMSILIVKGFNNARYRGW